MPNQDISLNNYDPDLAKILRQQQYAQSLRDQSQEAIPINSYNGIQAPISPFSILAKALQGYSARKYAEQSDQRLADLQTSRGKDLANILRGQYQKPGMPAQGVGMPSITPEPGSITDPLLGNSSPITFPTTRADPTQGAVANAQAPRPTTPQEQQDNAAKLFSSSNPQARALGMQFYQEALQKQKNEPYYQSVIAAAPANVQPILTSALASGNTEMIDKYAATAAGKMTPQAVNQATELTPEQAGIPANQLPPGAKIFRKPDNTIEIVKASDMMSPGRFGQDVRLSQIRANNTANAQAGGPQAPIAIDANSNSLNAQTGLSQMAIDRITNAPNQPRSAALVARVNKELTDYSIKNNVNMATLRARAAGINNVVTQNTQRNNQANILENELSGSVENLAPLLDQMHNGVINKANVISIWAGRQVNDPTAQQAADQLARMRNELAGYNAVAGGHLLENGTPNPGPRDYADAENTIMGGINSGGAKAVAQSVGMSAKKNRAVLANAIDDANQQLWDAFGVGKNYKRTNASPGANPPPSASPPVNLLQEGHNTTFKNGQVWTLQGGKTVRIK